MSAPLDHDFEAGPGQRSLALWGRQPGEAVGAACFGQVCEAVQGVIAGAEEGELDCTGKRDPVSPTERREVDGNSEVSAGLV